MVLPKSIDIDDEPHLLQLVSSLQARHESIRLRLAGQDVAIITPVSPTTRAEPSRNVESEDDLAEFLSLAGGWADMDTESLIDEIYRQRAISTRPSVDL